MFQSFVEYVTEITKFDYYFSYMSVTATSYWQLSHIENMLQKNLRMSCVGYVKKIYFVAFLLKNLYRSHIYVLQPNGQIG
jgi:hypothetical protein